MLSKEVIILVADDDDGHAGLIRKNLERAGITNTILRFADGQEVLDYLADWKAKPGRESSLGFVLLLDIRMPKVDGIQVLRQVKSDPELRKMPVIMITTTDDPREVEQCHDLGCNCYITKPVEYEAFVHAIRQLGMFLCVVQVPALSGSL